MKIDQLLTTLAARGVTQAALRAGNQMQLQVNGEWQAQNATLTDESLSALIEEALEPEARAAWDSPDGRASFERQGYSVVARRSGSAVQILIKQSAAIDLGKTAVAPVQTVAAAPVQAPTSAPVQGLTPAALVGWFYIDGETEKGPFPTQQLQMMIGMGTLPAHTLVWREGMENWTPLQNTELAPHLPVVETMAPIASPTGGGAYQPRGRGGLDGNSSGSGESAIVPPEVGIGALCCCRFSGASHTTRAGGRGRFS